MSTAHIDPFLIEMADTFWQPFGEREKRPHDLAQAVALSNFSLVVVRLPALTLEAIEDWLGKRQVAYKFPCTSRSLHGCLLVYRDAGFIFVDVSDSEAEQRFTIAHEISHFILDYYYSRQQAHEQFGDRIMEVLNEQRAPSLAEKVQGALHGIDIEPNYHLLEAGAFSDARIWNAENRADQLAFELIAPADSVYNDLANLGVGGSYFRCLNAAKSLLTEKYGLPEDVADVYARHLAQARTGGPTALSFLGLE